MAETLTEIVCFDNESNISRSIYNVKEQAIFDAAHPKNEIYVQYPGTSTPADLYNKNGITSTWQVQTVFNGAFFRASGGNADPFISSGVITKQSSQNNYHKHTVNSHHHDIQHTHTRGNWEIKGNLIFGGRDIDEGHYNTGAFEYNAATATAFDYKSGEHYKYGLADFYASRTWNGSTSDSMANQNTEKTNPTLKKNTNDANPTTMDYQGSSTDQEARPDNYTIRIWKRTA